MIDSQHAVPDPESNLFVGTTYASRTSDIANEPISTLLPCGNMGGFRARGSIENNGVDLVALVTTFSDPEWPDDYDEQSGRFTHFGDNKKPGSDLHETARKGNRLLRWVFSAIHTQDNERHLVPPFFVFAKKGANRAARFLGVAVPGATDCPESEDLIASWTTRGNDRFQNYRALVSRLQFFEAEGPKESAPHE